MGASMFLHHTPLLKHGCIHVFSTEGDPKAHKVVKLTCFEGHLYPQLEEGSERRLWKTVLEEGSQRKKALKDLK